MTEITRNVADRALHRSLSRRSFFKGAAAAAGLAVVWKSPSMAQDATPAAGLPSASSLVDVYNPQPAIYFAEIPSDVDSYLSIDENGAVTLRVGLVEFGQGIRTGLAQLAAEELDTPFESVSLIMGQTDEVPFNIGTFGSLSIQLTGPIVGKGAAEMR